MKELETREVHKRLAAIEGKTFTRFNTDARHNSPYKDHVFVLAKRHCHADGEYMGENEYIPDAYGLMVKHDIARTHDPNIGWSYQSIVGDSTLMPVEIYGEEKAIFLAILAKHNQLN